MLPAYVVLLSPDYHVPFANRFFEERFGKSEGRRCYEYLFNRTEPCETCETYTVLKTRQPHHWEWTGPDGRNYNIFDFPFTDVDGAPLIMEVGLDITERKKAEAELTKHRHHLEDVVGQRTGQLEAANAQLQAVFERRERRHVAVERRGRRQASEQHDFTMGGKGILHVQRRSAGRLRRLRSCGGRARRVRTHAALPLVRHSQRLRAGIEYRRVGP